VARQRLCCRATSITGSTSLRAVPSSRSTRRSTPG
jgi:hypothetical protein